MKLITAALMLMVPLASACLAAGDPESTAAAGSEEAALEAEAAGGELAVRAATPAEPLARSIHAFAGAGLDPEAGSEMPLLCGFRSPDEARFVVTNEAAYDKIVAGKRDMLARLRSGKVHSSDLVVRDVSLDAWGGSVSVEAWGDAVMLAGDGAEQRFASTKALRGETLVIAVKGAGEVRIDGSITATGLKNLVVLLDDNAHDVELGGALPCVVVDGGAEASHGPLRFNGDYGALDVGYTPLADIYGTSGADTLVGTTGNDNILGYAGNDNINGNLGADSLAGGDDNDVVAGNRGSDSINGNAGNDTVYGDGSGTFAGGDNDVVRGGAGDDWVYGSSVYDYSTCYGDNDYDYCSVYFCNVKYTCEGNAG